MKEIVKIRSTDPELQQPHAYWMGMHFHKTMSKDHSRIWISKQCKKIMQEEFVIHPVTILSMLVLEMHAWKSKYLEKVSQLISYVTKRRLRNVNVTIILFLVLDRNGVHATAAVRGCFPDTPTLCQTIRYYVQENSGHLLTVDFCEKCYNDKCNNAVGLSFSILTFVTFIFLQFLS